MKIFKYKTAVDGKLSITANQSTTYGKTEIDNMVYTQPVLDAMFATHTSNVVDFGNGIVSLCCSNVLFFNLV